MHKTTQNIGDDIQSYAAARLLPKVDYFLDREHLDDFKTDDGKPIAVVMSAWYMWHKWNWPPSRYIVPLFVGMHYTDNELAKQDGSPVKTEFLTGKGAEYLNAYAPVGCRDTFTEQTLKQQGIDCYFSGCITLTLPKMPRVEPEREYVCCVDVSKEVVERTRKLLEGTGIELRVIKHYKDYRNSDATWDERVKSVTDLLTIYQNAKCVITRRLHCALPCLAMEVPVLVLKGEKAGADIRFEPYYDWMHCCERSDYISGTYEYDVTNPPENSKKYQPYRESLLKTVEKFVNKYQNATGNIDEFNKFNCNDYELVKWRHDTMKDCMNRWLYVTRKHINTLKKKNESLKKKEKLLKDNERELEVKSKEIENQKAVANQLEIEKIESEQKIVELMDKCTDLESKLLNEQKRSAELEQSANNLQRQLEDTGRELNEKSEQLSHLKNVVSCKCVKYPVAIRNAFVSKKKKIKL